MSSVNKSMVARIDDIITQNKVDFNKLFLRMKDVHQKKLPPSILPCNETLEEWFSIVDESVFNRILQDVKEKEKIVIQMSNGLNFGEYKEKKNFQIAGLTRREKGKKRRWSLHMNNSLFMNLYMNPDKTVCTKQKCNMGPFSVGGVPCKQIMDCYIKIFCHEMCHLVIYVDDISNNSKINPSHGALFNKLSLLFGIKDHNHALSSEFEAEFDVEKTMRIIQKSITKKDGKIFYKYSYSKNIYDAIVPIEIIEKDQNVKYVNVQQEVTVARKKKGDPPKKSKSIYIKEIVDRSKHYGTSEIEHRTTKVALLRTTPPRTKIITV